MHQEVVMIDNYGPFKKGETYRVYGTGRDYCKLKGKGHIYCVPFSFIEGGELWGVIATGQTQKFNKKNKTKKQGSQSSNKKRVNRRPAE